MVSYVTPKKNTEFIIYIGLPATANPNSFKANPTIAAGDFKVSKDGGALANLATLPTVTPAGGSMVKITLSATEMNADNITVVAADAAGSEWQDVMINIQTTAVQIDGLAEDIWTRVIEAGFTAEEILRVMSAVLAGTVSGAGTGTETFKGLDGTTDRVVSTVDSVGNRTSVVVDGS